MSNYKIETNEIHAGYQPNTGDPRILPIVQSTTFLYNTTQEMADLFDLKASGYFYSRLQNPTCDSVAAKICTLEKGVAAMLTSSGQAANFFAIFNICEAGGHIISSSEIYGGTYNLFNVTLRKMGIEVTFVDPKASAEEIEAAIQPNTQLIFGETLSNPTLKVLDIEKFAKVAHKNNLPLIIDNTFATPALCTPFDYGCDIVVHSTTKYIDGHARTVGGCIVDSGNFDWNCNAKKFKMLTEPDDSYHGLIYTETFGKASYITKAVVQLMRDIGACQSPQNAFYLNSSLEDLSLRMERHSSNALTIAKYLAQHEKVSWVTYPGLEDDPEHECAKKYLPKGQSGVVCFGLKGGRDVSVDFMDSLQLISMVTHVADARTSVLHPASHTHRQLSEEQLLEVGVRPDLIRLSVGIENVDDLISDLENAFHNIESK